ncbi:MAG: hypothetical protein AAF998_08875 [Bacteroidota bacterium]
MKIYLYPRLLGLGMMLCQSCTLLSLDDPTQPVPTEEVIRLTSPAIVLPADGVSSTVITAQLGEQADDNQRIQLSTDAGKLREINGTDPSGSEMAIELGAGGREAKARFVAGLTPTTDGNLVAAVDDFSTTQSVVLTTAYPENASLQPDAFQVDVTVSGTTNLKVSAFRSLGTPSDGLRVRIAALPQDGSVSAQAKFDEFLELSNGEAQTQISPIGSGTGTLVFSAAIPIGVGDSLRKTVAINFQ